MITVVTIMTAIVKTAATIMTSLMATVLTVISSIMRDNSSNNKDNNSD